MKKIIPFLMLALFSAASLAATMPASKQDMDPRPAAIKKKATKRPAAQAPAKKRARRVLKYVAPPDWIGIESVPLTGTIPEDVIVALAKDKIAEAVRLLRVETPTARSLYLLRDAQKVLAFKKEKIRPSTDQHKFYQNLGIAHHNLFLFLKRNGKTNRHLYNSAMKFYKKAYKSESMAEKTESHLLMATLMAANGKVKNAQKLFMKLDAAVLVDDAKTHEYLASYHAAMGNVAEACAELEKAHEMNPEQIRIWTAISDDFYNIETEAPFKELSASWAEKRKSDLAKANAAKKKKRAKKTPSNKKAPAAKTQP